MSNKGILLLVGLGGLFLGVTGPLLSAFVPLLVRDALGEHRAAIGAVMAIDNALLLLLVPLAGAASDRATARGGGRLPLVLSGLILAACGMALFPSSAGFGITGLIGAIVVLYSGINIQRSPFQALVADLVPSRYRLARDRIRHVPDVRRRHRLPDARTDARDAARFPDRGGHRARHRRGLRHGLREPPVSRSAAAEATYKSLLDAARSALRGLIPGMRAVFAATFLLQLTFQTFSTWYALHGTERFGGRPEDVTTGFIAWAVGGVIGALPAGMLGVRIGRRNAMLLGFGLMAACLVALTGSPTASQAVPLLALASASWTLPQVNAYPLFVEPVPRQRRGVLAALFLLCMALGGVIGDPLNGTLFDLVGSYRPLFLLMAGYTALAFVAVLFVPVGAGEAGTGPDAVRPSPAPG